MNRDANGVIVCCGCDHSFNTQISILLLGVSEKDAPHKGRTRLFLSIFLSGYLAQLLRYAASPNARRTTCTPGAWAETAGLVLEPNPSLKMGVTIGKGFWAKNTN